MVRVEVLHRKSRYHGKFSMNHGFTVRGESGIEPVRRISKLNKVSRQPESTVSSREYFILFRMHTHGTSSDHGCSSYRQEFHDPRVRWRLLAVSRYPPQRLYILTSDVILTKTLVDFLCFRVKTSEKFRNVRIVGRQHRQDSVSQDVTSNVTKRNGQNPMFHVFKRGDP